jgi:hypothetical protein
MEVVYMKNLEQNNNSSTNGNIKNTKPEVTFKVGPVSASVFANEISTMKGKAIIKSVSLRRTYMGKDGKFQTTNSFRTDDIPRAILALRKSFEYMALEERDGQAL